LEIKVLKVLIHAKGIYGNKGINTYEVCRIINGVKNRSFCHKHRPFVLRENGNFKGAQDPRKSCSNDTLHCCEVSFTKVSSTLKSLEKKKLVTSKRLKGMDIKRMPKFIQISRDYYRFWFCNL